MIYANKEEADAKLSELKANGWKSVPRDNPTKATYGYFVYKPRNGGLVEEFDEIEWDMFTTSLRSDIQEISPEEMIKLITENPNAVKYDDAEKLKLGLVWYRPDLGVAITRYISLESFKRASENCKQAIVDFRLKLETLACLSDMKA